MPTKEDRYAFAEAIKSKKSSKIRQLLQHDDAKELLLLEHSYLWQDGFLPIHDACHDNLDSASLQLILDAAVEHGIIKEMLEAKNKVGTCLAMACYHNLHIDSLRLLFQYLSKYADINEMLENRIYRDGNCLSLACEGNLSMNSFQLILDVAVEHGMIKKMLEEKDNEGRTCLHQACSHKLSFDSLHLLLEYLSKWVDIKTIFEARFNKFTVLHLACYPFGKIRALPADSMRLVISFFPTKELFTHVLYARCGWGKTAADRAEEYEVKKILQDPDCFEKCRLWLLRKHEKTFLYSLFPDSFDKTCQAFKELTQRGLSHSQQHSTIILIALMSSPAKFREAVDKTSSYAPMASYLGVFHKGDAKSDYRNWRRNIHLFREFYGQWPPCERKTATTYEGEGSCVRFSDAHGQTLFDLSCRLLIILRVLKSYFYIFNRGNK